MNLGQEIMQRINSHEEKEREEQVARERWTDKEPTKGWRACERQWERAQPAHPSRAADPKSGSSKKLLESECLKLAGCREVSKYVQSGFPAFRSQLLGGAAEPGGRPPPPHWSPARLLSPGNGFHHGCVEAGRRLSPGRSESQRNMSDTEEGG